MGPDHTARAQAMLARADRTTLATVTVLADALTTALVAARLAGMRQVDVDRMLAHCQDAAAHLVP